MSFLQTDLPDMTGKVVAGRLLAEVVGTGGFGVVYRALDVQSASFQSAIKCIRKVKNPRSKESIRQVREMILHRAVSAHPNIASIYEVFEDDEFLYVDMDYLPGGDLFSAIVDRMVFHHQDDLLKNVFIQILDAVQWCHNNGIAHRDIKPENVLCNEDYTQVYLADFGLSSEDGLSEEFGCGSTFYTSPECIGKQYGFVPYYPTVSDIWSLGVLLVNLITRRNPWRTATTEDSYFLSYVNDPDSLMSMLEISLEAHHILKEIFTLDPADRITLQNLRKAILRVEDFFPRQQLHQHSLQPHLPIKPRVVRVVDCDTAESAASARREHLFHPEVLSSPVDSYVFPTPDPNTGAPVMQSPKMEYLRSRLYRSYDSDDSDDDSDGIITPPSEPDSPIVPVTIFEEGNCLNTLSSISCIAAPISELTFTERKKSARSRLSFLTRLSNMYIR